MLWITSVAIAAAAVPCSMSGELSADGTCRCDPGFVGTNCSFLDVVPRPFAGPALNLDFGVGNVLQSTWYVRSMTNEGLTTHRQSV
jgi:hypothetical protein